MARLPEPSTLPEFALLNRNDPISGQPNIVEPPQDKKDYGFTFREPAPQSWVNYQFREYYLWLAFFQSVLDNNPVYTVGTLPSASTKGVGAQAYVSDEIGGPTLALSDGTNWRRTSDNAIVS